MSDILRFPGLKQILEDKRIRSFGLPPEDKQRYLRCESFVVDTDGFGEKELIDMKATYEDLEQMGLTKPPVERFVLHTVVRGQIGNELKDIIDSVYVDDHHIYPLYDSLEKAQYAHKKIHELEDGQERLDIFHSTQIARLVVMLATRGIEKECRSMPTSRMITAENTAHKKGVGGYTLISVPTYSTSPEGEACRKVRAHFRRGHIRKYHPEDKTRWSWVSPCFVNGEPEVQRKAYLVA